ncbi:MAG: hypothetical protein QXQ53_01215 [Candidatus Methanosuratincola sp.]
MGLGLNLSNRSPIRSREEALGDLTIGTFDLCEFANFTWETMRVALLEFGRSFFNSGGSHDVWARFVLGAFVVWSEGDLARWCW